MVKKLIITACVEAVVLALAALIDPHLLKENAVWVIVAAMGVLLLVGIYDWTGAQGTADSKSDSGSTQTSHGPNSPNLSGNFHGPVTITNRLPAEKQPAKSPHGYTLNNLDGLERVMRGPSAYDRARRKLEERAARCPEMPIYIALRKIAARIGDKDETNGFPKARQQLRQSALEGRVDVWGQAQIPPTHMDDNRHKGVWSPVGKDHWEDHRLHPRAAEKDKQEWPHTEEEEIGRVSNRYWNLKVHADDIDRRWPKQPRKTYHGYH